jgi:hypothetical protein
VKRSRGDHVAGSIEDEKELIEDEAANPTIAFLPALAAERSRSGQGSRTPASEPQCSGSGLRTIGRA